MTPARGALQGDSRIAPPASPARGFSLVEALISLAILGILLAFTVPLLAETVARERLHAASLETAVHFRSLRQRAVSEGCSFGLRFVAAGSSWSYTLYRDGNGNGIRTADILSGRDRRVEGPDDPATRFEGIRIGLPQTPVPQIPPGSGSIAAPGDPVKFGNSDLVGFSPSGSVSGGTLYLTDGARVAAVVVYGPTGRIRLHRYDSQNGWRGGF
ncbi:MAG: prepilin-type N-terminal cleavage/methylation domain-containing protein [Acidobacteria bacterium]|nr:prepilin-type N-terminal cleavage/methylation domain-containing protein [Acidobacteriota bacterium]MCI0658131.1 prepilin-type N-terminal cleavage/methylation domain-containing protein [Acidobacteriota bacterium]